MQSTKKGVRNDALKERGEGFYDLCWIVLDPAVQRKGLSSTNTGFIFSKYANEVTKEMTCLSWVGKI